MVNVELSDAVTDGEKLRRRPDRTAVSSSRVPDDESKKFAFGVCTIHSDHMSAAADRWRIDILARNLNPIKHITALLDNLP